MNIIVEAVDTIVQKDINSYYQHRRYKDPSAIEAFLWLITEMREVAMLLPQQEHDTEYALNRLVSAGEYAELALGKTLGWVRNNPQGKPKTEESLKGEIADCLMMLYKFAEKSEVSPFTALVEKMETKGWTGEGSMPGSTGGRYG